MAGLQSFINSGGRIRTSDLRVMSPDGSFFTSAVFLKTSSSPKELRPRAVPFHDTHVAHVFQNLMYGSMYDFRRSSVCYVSQVRAESGDDSASCCGSIPSQSEISACFQGSKTRLSRRDPNLALLDYRSQISIILL